MQIVARVAGVLLALYHSLAFLGMAFIALAPPPAPRSEELIRVLMPAALAVVGLAGLFAALLIGAAVRLFQRPVRFRWFDTLFLISVGLAMLQALSMFGLTGRPLDNVFPAAILVASGLVAWVMLVRLRASDYKPEA